jgi:hypothetical protein
VDVAPRQPALVLDVEADDAGLGEEPPPHLHRGAAPATLLVAADPELEERERLLAQVAEVTLVVGGVLVDAPLVGAELHGELSEVAGEQPAAALGLRVDHRLGRLRHGRRLHTAGLLGCLLDRLAGSSSSGAHPGTLA